MYRKRFVDTERIKRRKLNAAFMRRKNKVPCPFWIERLLLSGDEGKHRRGMSEKRKQERKNRVWSTRMRVRSINVSKGWSPAVTLRAVMRGMLPVYNAPKMKML